jgi:hypothetical protein
MAISEILTPAKAVNAAGAAYKSLETTLSYSY